MRRKDMKTYGPYGFFLKTRKSGNLSVLRKSVHWFLLHTQQCCIFLPRNKKTTVWSLVIIDLRYYCPALGWGGIAQCTGWCWLENSRYASEIRTCVCAVLQRSKNTSALLTKLRLCARAGRWVGRTCGLLRTPPSWRSPSSSTWWPSSSSASTRAPGHTQLTASGTNHQPQDYLGHMSADLTGNRPTCYILYTINSSHRTI